MNPELIQSVAFLKNLTEEERLSFSSLLTIQEIEARTKIFSEGEQVHRFHIVCHGTVHAKRMAQKREVLLARIPPGGFFGEINLFDAGLATASVYAIDKVTLASVDYDDMRQFMSENPAIGYKIVSALMGALARRLRQTNERFVNTLYWSGGE